MNIGFQGTAFYNAPEFNMGIYHFHRLNRHENRIAQNNGIPYGRCYLGIDRQTMFGRCFQIFYPSPEFLYETGILSPVFFILGNGKPQSFYVYGHTC